MLVYKTLSGKFHESLPSFQDKTTVDLVHFQNFDARISQR